jgi:hypothetical protein
MSSAELIPAISIDRDLLTTVVRRILHQDIAEVIDFHSKALTGGYESITSIYLVEGEAFIANGSIPWKVILKVVQPTTDYDDPQNFLYWKREALAYNSGLLYVLPGMMTAPQCYLIYEKPGGETWLWLEFIEDDVGKDWPLVCYGKVARRLGEFNGAYLRGFQMPDQPWIPRDWLRAYVENAAPAVHFLQENLDHPFVKRLFSNDMLKMVFTIWEARDKFYTILDSLPHAFCHQDAFKGNLFTSHDRLIGIDWSYLGPAVVGAEIVPLIVGSMVISGFPAKQARQLEQDVFDGYLGGLADVGCQVNSRDVRLAYCLTLILRYIIGGYVGQALLGLLDEKNRQSFETKSGTTGDEFISSSDDVDDYIDSILIECKKMVDFNH